MEIKKKKKIESNGNNDGSGWAEAGIHDDTLLFSQVIAFDRSTNSELNVSSALSKAKDRVSKHSA